jgi:hypothetical protein
MPGDWNVALPQVSYTVLVRNRGDEIEMFGEYVGMTAQKLCKAK